MPGAGGDRIDPGGQGAEGHVTFWTRRAGEDSCTGLDAIARDFEQYHPSIEIAKRSVASERAGVQTKCDGPIAAGEPTRCGGPLDSPSPAWGPRLLLPLAATDAKSTNCAERETGHGSAGELPVRGKDVWPAAPLTGSMWSLVQTGYVREQGHPRKPR